jgi:signal transduction histidine kinase
MRLWSFGSPRSTWIAAAVLAVLLSVLAVLQYRWIGEVSRAESQQRRARISAAAEHFSDDLSSEVARVFFAFESPREPRPGSEPGIAERWRRWRETAPQPGLVHDVYVVGRPAGQGTTGGELALTRVDFATGSELPVPWPADLLAVRRRLTGTADGPPPPPPFAFETDVPAVFVPLHRKSAGAADRRDLAIVVLDRRVLAGELFPELAERSFGPSRAAEYLVAVKGPGGLVYRSDPSLPEARYLPGDLTAPIRGAHRERRIRDNRSLPGAGSSAGPSRRQGLSAEAIASPWQLVISHREGSLEAAVERVRRRNLAVSLAVLVLLVITLMVLAVSAQRARDLARQQIEFVAGLTHELNTPLAAIRSAGQNLADGLVSGTPQVQRYGVLIEREGRRLSGMVAKALELAGIQSGNRTYRPEPVNVAEVVDEALADCRWVLEERGVAVERDLPPDLPLVTVDRAALRMAVQNLLDNAVKYAGSAGWIGVRARAGHDGREVSLMVEDRGPGIRPEDRPHLFEPFYRGRQAAGGPVHGSGLGLSLVRHAVEANRGSLSVGTGPGGSVFTIRLPAAVSPASPAAVRVASPAVETE